MRNRETDSKNCMGKRNSTPVCHDDLLRRPSVPLVHKVMWMKTKEGKPKKKKKRGGGGGGGGVNKGV